MKKFLHYMIGEIEIVPNDNLRSMVVFTIFNAGLRFAGLFGVVFVVVKAYRLAS